MITVISNVHNYSVWILFIIISFLKQASAVIDIDQDELKRKEAGQSISREINEKANALDKLHDELREKLKISGYREKIQILTLVPEVWSRKKSASVFGVSEYLIRKSKTQKVEKGILSLPGQKMGKRVSGETMNQVKTFYEDDEFSRQMPGRRDFVSVSKNVHVQKRLLLCNINELYTAFKEKYPELKLGFSRFASLRPKWCVAAGSAGTHSVCVCTAHQNAVLMVDATGLRLTYKDFMKLIVCDLENKMCMIHRCENCPGKEVLITSLQNQLLKDDESDDEIEVTFAQWQTTDRANLINQTTSLNEFIELLATKINNLTTHSFIAKSQSQYLKNQKENLSRDTCIVMLDFAENYAFMVQNEIQSFHWNNQQCTLHPAVVYYINVDNKLEVKSFTFISKDLTHDTPFVYDVQCRIMEYIKQNLPLIRKIIYFSDGCAGQYKNYKNFLNICYHKEDFGLEAEWNFFATSHGKSAVDGIGGTVKRVVARASMQRSGTESILTAETMFKFCLEKIPKITFQLIEEDTLKTVREKQLTRYELGRTIPGTRGFHFFCPISTNEIAFKTISNSADYSGRFSFDKLVTEDSLYTNVKLMDFVACKYDSNWWIGMVLEINTEEKDFKIKFFHPCGPAKSFYWPPHDDICWVPFTNFVCKLTSPSTSSGRTYKIEENDYSKVLSLV